MALCPTYAPLPEWREPEDAPDADELLEEAEPGAAEGNLPAGEPAETSRFEATEGPRARRPASQEASAQPAADQSADAASAAARSQVQPGPTAGAEASSQSMPPESTSPPATPPADADQVNPPGPSKGTAIRFTVGKKPAGGASAAATTAVAPAATTAAPATATTAGEDPATSAAPCGDANSGEAPAAESDAPAEPPIVEVGAGKRVYRLVETVLEAINRPLDWLGSSGRRAVGRAAIASLVVTGASVLTINTFWPHEDAYTFLAKLQAEPGLPAGGGGVRGASAGGHGEAPKDDGHGGAAATGGDHGGAKKGAGQGGTAKRSGRVKRGSSHAKSDGGSPRGGSSGSQAASAAHGGH
jgi:DNA polymerase-3 subunit gamma/tau